MQNEFYDEFDAKIYEAMLELGWIIPQTEEEVEIAERGLKDVEIPPFDFDGCLERIKEKIKMQEHTITVKELLNLLIKNGGSIRSSNDFKDEELRVARREKRFAVDDNGMGFVWVQ